MCIVINLCTAAKLAICGSSREICEARSIGRSTAMYNDSEEMLTSEQPREYGQQRCEGRPAEAVTHEVQAAHRHAIQHGTVRQKRQPQDDQADLQLRLCIVHGIDQRSCQRAVYSTLHEGKPQAVSDSLKAQMR